MFASTVDALIHRVLTGAHAEGPDALDGAVSTEACREGAAYDPKLKCAAVAWFATEVRAIASCTVVARSASRPT